MRFLLPFLALALLLAACAPTDSGEPTNPCAATLCLVGTVCEVQDGEPVCVPQEGTIPPTEEKLIECIDPRPEICTMQYDPVCASVDNGIRCITQPCPSEDRKTYGNACSACGDPKVYGYTPGECDPEVDNNPADDEVPPCAATLCMVGSTCVEGVGCVEQGEARLAFTPCTDPRPEMCTREYNPVCGENADGERVTQSTACTACADPSVVGYWPGTCEQPPSDTPGNCAASEDEYASQTGPACVTHAGETEIRAWTQCENAADCGDERCALAASSTSGSEISWASEADSFRCVPEDYALFLLHTSGLTAIDENGERTTAIA